MKSVNHSVCIYLFVLTYFVLTYFVPKMIVKIGKRPGRIHRKKRCDISVFNGTMAHAFPGHCPDHIQCFFRAIMADNINKPGVAALKEGNINSFFCLILMFILSYILGNMLFKVFSFLIRQITVRGAQISFKLHEHVDCSPFE